jgi:hypothetical protein
MPVCSSYTVKPGEVTVPTAQAHFSIIAELEGTGSFTGFTGAFTGVLLFRT